MDIRGYFNHINHEWLRKMVAHRIADPVILRLIGRWLRAGVMMEGVVVRMHEGSPQGGPISPVLSNIYLHYILDLWFEKKFKRRCQGEAYLTRFADDCVVCFQYKRDAEHFDRDLTERMEKFGLELARETTRMLLFGRFARERMAEFGKKPETFEFLGFKHVCGVDRNGKAAVVRIPSTKSCRKFLDRTREWLRRHMHWRRRDQQRELATASWLLPVLRAHAHDAETLLGSRRGSAAVASRDTTVQSTQSDALGLPRSSTVV